jgi:phosphoribosylglycinamide formyltransferase-1
MRIGVFAYNFEHWKTQAGIQNLMLAGRKPEVIFAANRVKLNFYQSKIRTSPKDLYLVHPKRLSEYYNIDYCIAPHNSKEVSSRIEDYGLDLGIILGARILKPPVFLNFRTGVLNMHPGILPENRGLDTIKWAIVNELPQGVSTHLIDEKIDRGALVQTEQIRIYQDDTLLDLHIRIQNLEQKLMLSSIELLEKKNIIDLKDIGKGRYNKSMLPDLESDLAHYFAQYKEKYSQT